MIGIHVRRRDGSEHRFTTRVGVSLMEALRSNGVDEVLALCGGSCSCGTCHVFVVSGRDELLAPAAPMEAELLDFSDHRQPTSRLACQILLTDADDGLSVEIAPEES